MIYRPFSGKGLIYALYIVFLSGCAGPAIDAMNEAHREMELARQAHAEKYAPVPMTLASANYELARDNIIKDTRKGNRRARHYAMEATEQARRAESEAGAAYSSEQKRRRQEYEEKKKKEEEARKLDENPELVARRYVALARRRLKFAAMSKMGASPPKGFVEIEVWIAPNGYVTQILIIEGDPDSMLARAVMQGIRGVKLEPFPEGISRKYLKLRLTIDTRR